tara:strand:+ start:870 stop:1574 length:705 start_codon:yes stop_codon:yes gene_type:complete
MDPITMGLMMGGSQLFSSILGGQSQVAQNAIQRAQWEEQEYNRQLNNQIKNRNIAKANAAKWMQNVKIGKAAAKAKGEQEFWLRYNFDNASGQFSRQSQKVNDSLQTSLLNRNVNPNSGTAQALLRQSLETANRGMTSRKVQFSNALVSADRQMQQTLAKRDFGYRDQEKFIPGQLYQQSDSSIMQNALISGLVSGAMTGVAAGMQQHLGEQQVAALEGQLGAVQGYLQGLGGQ